MLRRLAVLSLASTGVGFATVAALSATSRPAKCEERPKPSASLLEEHTEEGWNNDWDHAEALRETKEGTGRRHVIVLCRHGQYVHDAKDKPLTELGRLQARKLGHRLGSLQKSGILPPFKRFIYSTMTRAAETAECMSEGLGIELVGDGLFDSGGTKNHALLLSKDMVWEASSTVREGAPIEPVPASWRWQPSDNTFWRDGARIEGAFREIVTRPRKTGKEEEEATTTVVVCHGNVIRFLVMRALQLPANAWLRTAVYNGSFTVLDVGEDGRVSLRGMGDVGHLDAGEVTYQ